MTRTDPFRLDGKRALVTGATHGLGEAMARGLGRAGATLVVNGHSSQERIDAAVERYRADGITASGYLFDVTKPDEVADAVERIEAEVGPIDILVNNAAVIERTPLLDMAVEDWKRVIETDLTGVFVMSQPVARGMVERGGGKVINVCSMMSELGRDSVGAYAAAKGGLKMLTRSMATEWGRLGVQVNGVEPGNNALYLTNTAHSWVRDIEVVNGDSGILTDVCSNITIDGVRVYGRKYHYAVHQGDCYGVLVRDVYVAAPVVHTFSFNTGSRMSVYTHSSATGTPVLDQHSGLNYMNLFDDVTLYIDDPDHQPIAGGGAGYWKPSHAAFPVFWNVELDFLYPDAGRPVAIEGLDDGPSARIVGLHANAPLTLTYGPGATIEGLNRADLAVPSLYEYQLRRRLTAEASTSSR